MISSTSRYISNKVCRVQDSTGKYNLAVCHGSPADLKLSYTYYTIRQGDRLDILAGYQYNDPTMWWVIADANPEILYWDSLPAGTLIRVPVDGISLF